MGRLLAIQQRVLKSGRIDLTELAVHIVDTLPPGSPGATCGSGSQPGLEAEGDPCWSASPCASSWAMPGNSPGAGPRPGSKWAPWRAAAGASSSCGTTVPASNPAAAAQVFQPFRKAHGRQPGEGLGLGLAIARDSIGRHGGRIWAEPMPGRGVTIYFTLAPADRRGPCPQRGSPEDPAPGQR